MISIGLQWLEQKVPQFANLSDEEKTAIFDFSILWSFFEGTKLNNKANVQKIRSFVENLEGTELDSLEISEYVCYLKNRYVSNGGFTDKYYALNLERSGNPPEVNQMLNGVSQSKAIDLKACLVIIFRLRNNLFHGEKWRYNLVGQYENFSNASKTLMALMK